MSLHDHDLCSSESSDSVGSVIYVNVPTVIANGTTANQAITKRPTASCVGRRQALDGSTVHGDRPSIDRDGGGLKRPRQKSPPPMPLVGGNVDSNGCYDDSSDSSSEEDEDGGRRMMDVDDDNGCGGRCQLDMDTSSSSSESSQIWNPTGSVGLSLSGRQLKSPPPKTSTSYRSSTGAINQSEAVAANKSRCWSLLVRTDEDEADASKAQRLQQRQGCESDDASVVISNLNVSGFLETDIDEEYQSHVVVDNDHPRRSLVAPADSGFGNETSPELADDDINQSTGKFPALASIDQSPCSSVAMRPLPQPSLSFCSPSCSFLRSSMSSIQQQQQQQLDDDDDDAADCAAIYSTPSTCRASLRRMQSTVPLPSDDTGVGRTNSVGDHDNANYSPPYKTLSRLDTSTMLSCLYAMFVIVVGTSLSLAEVLMDTMSVATFEGFYSSLFIVGIAFLIFVQLSVDHRHSKSTVVCSKRQQCRSDCGSESHGGVEMGLLDKTANGNPSLPAANTCVDVDKDGGTFFLRLGAVGFAIGAMVSEGLQLAQFIEMQRQTVPSCINANEVIRTFLHIVFIFTQLYFIFMHSETQFHRCPSLCRLGLMHLIATDICVWLRVIVLETLSIGAASRLLHSSSSADDVISGASSSPFVNVTSPAMAVYYHHSTVPLNEIVASPLFQVERVGFHNDQVVNSSAQRESFMACKLPDVTSGLISSLSPFLYPCIIQYCWAAIALNGLVWYNVGARRKRSNYKTPYAQKHIRQFDERDGSGSGTSSGVFGGLIVLVATVVILVVALVLSAGSASRSSSRSSTSFSTDAVLTAEAMSDGIRLTVSAIALLATIVVAVCLSRRYNLVSGRSSVGADQQVRPGTILNEILLVISLAGVLAAAIFGAVAGRRIGRRAAIAGCIASAAHAAIQAVALVAGSRRVGPTWRLSAIGRQSVAFLTVCNVAAWLIDVTQEGGLRRLGHNGLSYGNDGQLSYQVLGLVCVPLAVFHRFQSVVCLSAIWKRG